jgi:diguanylate cyclase (GGDEF)-like protein
VRLITRSDASLAVALIAAAVVVFERPLRYGLDLAQDVEARYHVDLIPALAILLCVFVFHQTRKRQLAKADARAASAEAALAHRRSAELEQMVAFGQALANALEPAALKQTLWRHLATFARDRECWVVVRRGQQWDMLLPDESGSDAADAQVSLAAAILGRERAAGAHVEGVLESNVLCYPLVASGAAVGVLGVEDAGGLQADERRALGAVAASLAIAVRNVQLIQTMRESSLRDSLTGCFNRGHAVEAVERELRLVRRTGRPVSILLLDIDHFKSINDQHGHLRGDDVLRAVSAQLSRTLRSTDVRCRYGGDEFLVILPDTPVLGAEQVAECLRREIGAMAIGDGAAAFSITISLGIAGSAPEVVDAARFIERADAALYQAKRAGRDRWTVSNSQLATHNSELTA